MIADPDQLDRELGKGGNRVSVNYDVQQFWNVYGEECSRMEVYKSGHVIEPHSKENASAQDSLLSAEYAQCMEKSGGVTVEMKDCLTAEDERIEALLNATYKKQCRQWMRSKRLCCVIPKGLGSNIGKVHAIR